MTKIRTTITIDNNLLKKAKHHNIRISTFLDRKLRECLSDFSNSNKVFDAPFSKKGAGYDVALTTRRSPFQFRPGSLIFSRKVQCETKVEYPFLDLSVFLFHGSR
jgi:hypothetical protein